ncbi:hypothetical protein [Aminobacter sp. Piv2-1]|uniref:hypothetical protein n=1 Tax=Aminobacter sp. Piv2-1 TaxID=3031122 RepID=UPI0030AF6544
MLARLGRTEDIRFSPSNRRLAIAGFGKSTCLLLDVEIIRTAATATLRINDYLQFESAALSEPHGFDFIDEQTLVVANRRGFVSLFRLPERTGVERTIELSPFRMTAQIRGDASILPVRSA